MEKIQFINQDIKEIYDFQDGKRFIEYADLDNGQEFMYFLSFANQPLV